MTDHISADKWDELCKQCGQCCFEKLEDGRGKIIYLRTACKYLDLDSRKCRIFERRFEINPSCIKLTEDLVPQLHWLPADCAYRTPEEKFTRKENRGRKKRGG